ncbi:Bug family tripartite tricarboxylate transporter substrate binding protein [Xanthobacter tagetidis]|jgi:tripartite-type tricarboxylate transporter receptor subunit TctC|uniref:Tripartite tricarboxylate transporter substrate binding protein n=1 Tax=Xanthobacter tagetidis TaxID=60216 RepID=A0A3L7A1E9_9HYPH|nr:tripartite tricarboxylate transporter substrate binding protein [Xanthobacter tagetidis]MBB6307201.1 tripartite-type tricarboxylate transporter receptor subunit TctC [Xanthobacter tagetidis]RLP74039.1 tripartite tricarboxylate transporter substrate binding protein [Xanthobacter tagetidis]
MLRHLIRACAVATLAVAVAAPAVAQSWPDKTVRLVVPYPPGGNVDGAARIIAAKLQDAFGKPFVVENKPGAGGMIAGETVARAAPDGYTLFVAANGPLLFSPIIFGRTPYVWSKDFETISSISFTPMVLQVYPSVPAKTVADFIALAKTSDPKLIMASPGAGTTNHLASELLQKLAGAKWTTVHYKGNAPATTDVLAGRVQFNFDQVSVALPYVKDGKTRALAVTSATRVPQLPDVPTFQEAGFADFEATTFTGLFAPAKTPAAVVNALADALAKILAEPEVVERFATMGSEARAMKPEAFHAYVAKLDARWTQVIKDANIKAE